MFKKQKGSLIESSSQDGVSHSFKTIIDLIIPMKAENFEQAIGCYVLKGDAAS
jgi:hypothetical protein